MKNVTITECKCVGIRKQLQQKEKKIDFVPFKTYLTSSVRKCSSKKKKKKKRVYSGFSHNLYM